MTPPLYPENHHQNVAGTFCTNPEIPAKVKAPDLEERGLINTYIVGTEDRT